MAQLRMTGASQATAAATEGRRRRGGLPKGLARRLGLLGRRRVASACVVLVVVAVTVGIVAQAPRTGTFIETSGAPEAATATTGDEAASESASGEGGAGEASAGDAEAAAAEPLVVVHVDGAVASPGVYRLHGSYIRVEDAVEAAGGLAEGADTTQVNLAATLADGTKVHIPAAGEQASSGVGVVASAGSAVAGGTSSGTTDGPININQASSEELQELPGVGPAPAEAIGEDRESNGPFASPEDIMRVSGIGEKKFAKMEGSICV